MSGLFAGLIACDCCGKQSNKQSAKGWALVNFGNDGNLHFCQSCCNTYDEFGGRDHIAGHLEKIAEVFDARPLKCSQCDEILCFCKRK